MNPLDALQFATRHMGTMIKIGCSIEEIKEFNLHIEIMILRLTEEEVRTPQFDKCQETLKNNLTLLQEFFLTS